jgi:DNA-directed RNA polymerase I, II, and III subunit RPABC5
MKIQKGTSVEKVVYLTKEHIEKTPEGVVLDTLGLTNVCCRRHMLTHVDIE